MNDIKKPVNDDEITENDKFEYYQSLVVSMNSKMNVKFYILIIIIYIFNKF